VSVLLRQTHGFEGTCAVGKVFPSNDSPPTEMPNLDPLLLERDAAATASPSFVHGEDDARPGIDDFLGIEFVRLPRAPVATRGRDDCVPPDINLVEIENGTITEVPYNVLVEQCPKRFCALCSASDRLHVLLRHRPRSIAHAT
jgi:hypothetical protein